MFDSLLDDDPYIQEVANRAAERAAIQVLQRAVLNVVKARFPALAELAQQQVAQINSPDNLDLLIQKISTAPDESLVRWLLSPAAAS